MPDFQSNLSGSVSFLLFLRTRGRILPATKNTTFRSSGFVAPEKNNSMPNGLSAVLTTVGFNHVARGIASPYLMALGGFRIISESSESCRFGENDSCDNKPLVAGQKACAARTISPEPVQRTDEKRVFIGDPRLAMGGSSSAAAVVVMSPKPAAAAAMATTATRSATAMVTAAGDADIAVAKGAGVVAFIAAASGYFSASTSPSILGLATGWLATPDRDILPALSHGRPDTTHAMATTTVTATMAAIATTAIAAFVSDGDVFPALFHRRAAAAAAAPTGLLPGQPA